MPKPIVVIGARPAGVEAAICAAQCGSQVRLIAAHAVASWYRLISSQAWLMALDSLEAARRLGLRGV